MSAFRMPQFVKSVAGRVVGAVAAAALVVPSITLGLASRAVAGGQLVQNPVYAVVDFRDSKKPDSPYGQRAAEAVSSFLGRTGRYDIVPRETVVRTVETLGLTQPLPTLTNILRVGQELRASTIVSGDIVDYQVVSSPQGKQAQISMRVVANDVASGIAVNGAGVSASSTVRSGDVSDETLINDAIQSAANTVVQTIQSQTLPSSTVRNTFRDAAIIGNGSRSGFKTGMELIVTRGREQVATATVTDVEPGSATIKVSRSFKGLQPGDKVRAVFTPPNIVPGFSQNGSAKVTRARKPNNLSGLLLAALAVGLIVVLASGNNGNSQEVASELRAQPSLDAAGQPAVTLDWGANGFAKGNAQRYRWQLYRDDNSDAPVLLAPGDQTRAIDGAGAARTFTFSAFAQTGGFICTPENTQNPIGSGRATTSTAPQLGRPYTYSIELVYGLLRQDTLSGVSTTSTSTTATTTGTTGTATGTTSTTATTTTTGTTTGITGTTTTGTGTTTTGTTTGVSGADTCYFISARTQSIGTATPLARPQLVSPANNAVLSLSTPFTFVSSATTTFPVTLGYVLQLSSSPVFQKNLTYTYPEFVRTEAGTIATDPINTSASTLPAFIRNATTVYFRIGARNVQDKPGPVKDPATGLRYIFSAPSRFTRPSGPPPPPGF